MTPVFRAKPIGSLYFMSMMKALQRKLIRNILIVECLTVCMYHVQILGWCILRNGYLFGGSTFPNFHDHSLNRPIFSFVTIVLRGKFCLGERTSIKVPSQLPVCPYARGPPVSIFQQSTIN